MEEIDDIQTFQRYCKYCSRVTTCQKTIYEDKKEEIDCLDCQNVLD